MFRALSTAAGVLLHELTTLLAGTAHLLHGPPPLVVQAGCCQSTEGTEHVLPPSPQALGGLDTTTHCCVASAALASGAHHPAAMVIELLSASLVGWSTV